MECFHHITDHSILLHPGEDGEGAVLELGADGLVGGQEVSMTKESVKIYPGGRKNTCGASQDGDGGGKAESEAGSDLENIPAGINN